MLSCVAECCRGGFQSSIPAVTMPLQILEGETPTPPAWGSLSLEVYVLSESETPYPSHPTEPESLSNRRRRRRLVRQFLALGHGGREVCISNADSKQPGLTEY